MSPTILFVQALNHWLIVPTLLGLGLGVIVFYRLPLVRDLFLCWLSPYCVIYLADYLRAIHWLTPALDDASYMVLRLCMSRCTIILVIWIFLGRFLIQRTQKQDPPC